MTCDINSVGFAIDPSNTPSFLLDWEVTKLCNLDCSYCPVGVEEGGHDNSTKHPPLDECLDSIDFMYEYVDVYMKYKKPTQRKVVLNVYGGESIFHPNIVQILQECRNRYEKYKDLWHLTILCTTNGIVGENRWREIVPLVDNFTLSYHSENLPKQKEIFKNNALYLKESNKPFNAVIVMHNQQKYWDDCLTIIDFFNEHKIAHYPKPLDSLQSHWDYTAEQFTKLKTFWAGKPIAESLNDSKKVNSLQQGRPCCGGRKLSVNGDFKTAIKFVPRQDFRDWYCSVNWFFLYVQQITGNIYTNKDCRMSTTGKNEPLGNLSNSNQIIDNLTRSLENKEMPIIQCANHRCICGFCAPKANDKTTFLNLIKYNVVEDVFQTKSL